MCEKNFNKKWKTVIEKISKKINKQDFEFEMLMINNEFKLNDDSINEFEDSIIKKEGLWITDDILILRLDEELVRDLVKVGFLPKDLLNYVYSVLVFNYENINEIIAFMNLYNDTFLRYDDYYLIEVKKKSVEDIRLLGGEYFIPKIDRKINKRNYLDLKQLEDLKYLYKEFKSYEGKKKYKIITLLSFILNYKIIMDTQTRAIIISSALETIIETPDIRGIKKYFKKKLINLYKKLNIKNKPFLIKKDFSDFYEIRSKVVHGDFYLKQLKQLFSSNKDIDKLVSKVEKFYEMLVREIILDYDKVENILKSHNDYKP